jgi:hypothetical protein
MARPETPLSTSSPVLFLAVEQLESDLSTLKHQVASRNHTIAGRMA